MSRSSEDRRRIAAFVFILLVAYIVLGVVIDQKRGPITYYVTQWMITYHEGFIRRGILGQIVWDLSASTHMAPVWIIKFFQYCLAVAYSLVVWVQCVKNRVWLGWVGLLIILSNPFVIKYIWLETGSSDLFFMLITFAHIGIVKKYPERYLPYATLLFATAGLFVALQHEAFIFLSLPVNVIITLRTVKERKLAALIQIFAVPVLACGLESIFHGNRAQSDAIANQWLKGYGIAPPAPNGGSVHYLSYSIPQELDFVKHVVNVKSVAVWVLGTLLCTTPLVLYALDILEGADEETIKTFKRFVRDFFVIPFLCTIPMYIIGSDWDRWPAIVAGTGVICYLMLGSREITFPKKPKLSIGWIAAVVVSLFLRTLTPNLTLGSVFTGPADITTKLVLNRRI